MSEMCEKIQRLGKGIASPTRYQIVEVLMDGPKSVTEIVSHMKLTQPAVSQHLRTLKSCGLVLGSKRGQEVYYSLNIRSMLEVLSGFTSNVKKCKQTSQKSSSRV